MSWKIRAQTGELNGPVKVSINVDEEPVEDEKTGEIKEELRVRTVLGFWADDAKDVPFETTLPAPPWSPMVSRSLSSPCLKHTRWPTKRPSLWVAWSADPS